MTVLQGGVAFNGCIPVLADKSVKTSNFYSRPVSTRASGSAPLVPTQVEQADTAPQPSRKRAKKEPPAKVHSAAQIFSCKTSCHAMPTGCGPSCRWLALAPRSLCIGEALHCIGTPQRDLLVSSLEGPDKLGDTDAKIVSQYASRGVSPASMPPSSLESRSERPCVPLSNKRRAWAILQEGLPYASALGHSEHCTDYKHAVASAIQL